MGIRRPSLSVEEAKRLANARLAASGGPPHPSPVFPSNALLAQEADLGETVKSDRVDPHSIEHGAIASVPASAKPARGQQPVTQTVPRERETAVESSLAPTSFGSERGLQPGERMHRNQRSQKAALSQTRIRPDERKVQVFVSALVPASGISVIFERLCQQYPSKKALQMILRRALHDYDRMLESGSFEKEPPSYPSEESSPEDDAVMTSRMMSTHLLEIARAHFDPMGLESTRAFGRKLATAALAAFFSQEANHRG